MSVYIIDKCERFVSQRAGCGKAASPDSVRGVRPQGVRLLDPQCSLPIFSIFIHLFFIFYNTLYYLYIIIIK